MPGYRVSISTAPSTSTTTTSISTSEFSQPESAARQRPQSSFVGIPIAVHTPDSTHLPVADQQHAELRLLAEASVLHTQADPFEALAAHRTVTFAHSDEYQEQSDDSSLLSNEPSQPVEGSDRIVKKKPCEVALSVSLPTNGRETNARTTTSISEQEILPSINDHFRRALSKTVPEALLTAITGVRQFPFRQLNTLQKLNRFHQHPLREWTPVLNPRKKLLYRCSLILINRHLNQGNYLPRMFRYFLLTN